MFCNFFFLEWSKSIKKDFGCKLFQPEAYLAIKPSKLCKRQWQLKFKHFLQQSQSVLPHRPYGRYAVLLLLTLKTWVTWHPPASTTIESSPSWNGSFPKSGIQCEKAQCVMLYSKTQQQVWSTSRKLESTHFGSKLNCVLLVMRTNKVSKRSFVWSSQIMSTRCPDTWKLFPD